MNQGAEAMNVTTSGTKAAMCSEGGNLLKRLGGF